MANSTAMEKLEAMMSGGVVPRLHDKQAILLHEEDLPEVALPDGSTLQLLQVDLNQNLWVLRARFKPGSSCFDGAHP
jgi:2,4'-dihydroxyacetophenone dioxygenase